MPKIRVYTVLEIDRMRRAVEHLWLFGCTAKSHTEGSIDSRVCNEGEMAVCVEERLRTYILAGIDPEELE